MIRTAFVHIGRDLWRGGYNYLLNLFAAIELAPRRLITPVLYAGDDVSSEELEPFVRLSSVEVVRSPLFNASNARQHVIRALLLGGSSAVWRQLECDRIAVVYEHARFFFGWRSPFPVVAWLPDFQHRHLPSMYGRLSWLRRELGYRIQTQTRRIIVLSSEDARRDCERFYACSRGRTRVLRFATRVPAEVKDSLSDRIPARYGLRPGAYFLFPSQFYKHKNHALVIKALAWLKKRGMAVEVAFSGERDSLRSRGLVEALQELARQKGVEHQVHFLGNVPYKDLMALLRHARAMLNPSLFEGWSTVVEEARSLGVPMLLSDLPVHREQMGEHAHYFDRHSSVSLARAMRDFPVFSIHERQRRESEALKLADQRVQTYGLSVQRVLSEALEGQEGHE
ncbi:MAG: glycosyltransferase [Zetaproteobacteria bacterium]|nr:MAG: glycosyltransferase [Zetaproteobacteria bacterium]